MDSSQALWEGVAADVLGSTGCDDPPVDAFELAECCGLEVRVGKGVGARLAGDKIYLNVRARDVRQHGLVAHEIGHWSLMRAAEPDPEHAARYMAGALMLPRLPFLRDLHDVCWDPRQLRARHLNASVEMIGRRVVSLCDAVVSIWDAGKLTRRIVSPWLNGLGTQPSRFERQLADSVFESGETVRADDLVWAVPVFTPGYRRVVLVCEAEQLSLRF